MVFSRSMKNERRGPSRGGQAVGRSLLLGIALCGAGAWADPKEYIATLDALYATRDDPESVKGSDAAISAGVKESPADYEILWRAARFRWWVADGVGSEQLKLKKQLAKEAWNYADRALKAKPGALEGHYFKALSIG